MLKQQQIVMNIIHQMWLMTNRYMSVEIIWKLKILQQIMHQQSWKYKDKTWADLLTESEKIARYIFENSHKTYSETHQQHVCKTKENTL